MSKFVVILKIKLKDKYEHNRDARTEAKTEFVKNYSRLAKERVPYSEKGMSSSCE